MDFMAKSFSKTFYNSAEWITVRDAYIAHRTAIDGGVCERCRENAGEELHHVIPLTPANINDYSITLDPANLKWLCKDCHFKVHREMILKKWEEARARNRKILNRGCYFNDDGELVQMKVYIVWGSPASGKSTYVAEHMNPGDLVVDLDNLKQAISLQPKTETPDNLLDIAIELRDCLYKMIEERAVDCKNVWVIAALPQRKEREALGLRLGAELIHMNAGYHECIRRAGEDDNRRDKMLQRALIDRYFERFEP